MSTQLKKIQRLSAKVMANYKAKFHGCRVLYYFDVRQNELWLSLLATEKGGYIRHGCGIFIAYIPPSLRRDIVEYALSMNIKS